MKGTSPTLLLVVVYGSAFLAGFNENLMNMGLMSIMDEFGIDSVMAQWTVTGYMIVATVVVTCMAFLFRRVPLRPLFFVASALTLAGSIMGLFAQSFAFLMAARIVQAAGSGVFIPLMMNTLLVVTPKNRLGTYMSIGGCMITFGPAFAPVVCGALVTALGWRSIFLVPAVAMAALAAMGALFVKNLETSEAHLDAPSVFLSAVALSGLSFGLAEITIAPIVGGMALIVAAAAVAAFIVRQLRCGHPLIDLTPAKSRAFSPSMWLVVVAMMSTFSLSVLLPLYFEGATGMTAFSAGLVMLVPVLFNAGATIVSGRIMDKRGEWPLLPVGFALVFGGFVVMAAVAPTLSVPAMFAAALLTFTGVGLVFSPSQTAGLRTLPPQLNPFGVALLTTFTQIAACIGPSMYIGIMSSSQAAAVAGGAPQASAVADGFANAVVVAAAVGLLGLIVAFAYARAAVRRDSERVAARQAQKRPPLLSIMESDPYTAPADAPVGEVMRELVDRKVSGMPLVDEAGAPAGFVSDGDIMRYLADKHPAITGPYSMIQAANGQTLDERLAELMALPATAIATQRVVAIPAEASLEDACTLLAQHKLKKVPVLRDGRIVGMLSRSDIMRYSMEKVATAYRTS